MSVQPPEEHNDNDNDTTMLEALNTAAALAAATAMEDSACRVSPTIIPAIITSTEPVAHAMDASSSKPTPEHAVSSNSVKSCASTVVPLAAPSPMPPMQGIPTHPYPSFRSAGGTQLKPVMPPMQSIQSNQSMQPLTHTVFQPDAGMLSKMKLRRGKWTSEEEAYAEVLIQEFERGQLEGCENGCTLRAFLSKKLHCAPMRISKKFAGKSIGKHVFLCRKNVSPSIAPAVGTCNKAKLQELESNFYKSLCREAEATVPYLSSFSGGIGGILSPLSNQVISSCAPAPFLPFPQPYGDQPNQLHQTFMNALIQQGSLTSSTPAPILPAPPRVSPLPMTHLALRLPEAQQCTQQRAPIGQALITRHATPLLSHSQPTPQQSSTAPQVPTVMRFSSMTTASDVGESANNEMPDFLSGFEKVAAETVSSHIEKSMKSSAERTALLPQQYSPPFTSKSFDDLHQHLGKGLSPKPLDLKYPGFPPLPFKVNDAKRTERSIESPLHPTLHIRLAPDVFTADSYAVFAQESVQAARQHSAYSQSSQGALDEASNSRKSSHFPCPAVVNAENLRAHSLASGDAKVARFREISSSGWAAFAAMNDSIGIVSGSDNSSDTPSNDGDSDSNFDDGPLVKKAKIELVSSGCQSPIGE